MTIVIQNNDVYNTLQSLGCARPSFDKAKSIRELTYMPLLAQERTYNHILVLVHHLNVFISTYGNENNSIHNVSNTREASNFKNNGKRRDSN